MPSIAVYHRIGGTLTRRGRGGGAPVDPVYETKIRVFRSGLTGTIVPPPSGFVMDETIPGSTNTGPAAGGYSNPTVINGNMTFTAGQTYTNLLINGYTNGTSGCILRGVTIRPPAGQGTAYPNRNSLFSVPSGLATPPRLEFCDIGYVEPAHYAMNGISATGPFILLRSNMHGGVDQIKINGPFYGGEIGGNWFHGHAFHNDDNDQRNSTPPFHSHNDHIQAQGSSTVAPNGVWLHGNMFDAQYDPTVSVGTPTSLTGNGVTFSPLTKTVDALITKNWFKNGDVGFQDNEAPANQGGEPLGEFSYNRFSNNQATGYQLRYAVAFGQFIGETTNYYQAGLPNVPGGPGSVVDGQLFTTTKGIKRG